MSTFEGAAAGSPVARLLGDAGRHGIKLWLEKGKLHYKAPKGLLTPQDLELLRASSSEIVAYLQSSSPAAEVPVTPRTPDERIPLTFSQLAHWQTHRLGERPGIRQIASATRLRGRLNVDALQESLATVVRRHEALRTRIVPLDGDPMQEVTEGSHTEIEIIDLSEVPQRYHEPEVATRIEQAILEPVDPCSDPLMTARLLKLGPQEHVLIVALEHIISDAFSMSILLRELFSAYVARLTKRALDLPNVPIQLADYAVWQRRTHSAFLDKHTPYWKRCLDTPRLRFPASKYLPHSTRVGWGSTAVHLDERLRSELRDWCKRRQTTLAMSVFAAYSALVLRWCDVSEGIFDFQSDGRVGRNTPNVIGYFATPLYVRAQLHPRDTLPELLARLPEEYCSAYEHADFSYLASRTPRPELTRNPGFNWVPSGPGLDLSALAGTDHELECSPVAFDHPMLKTLVSDDEPALLLYDDDREARGTINFPLDRLAAADMDRFRHNLLRFLKTMLLHPHKRIRDIPLL